jgi:hypothetical protein
MPSSLLPSFYRRSLAESGLQFSPGRDWFPNRETDRALFNTVMVISTLAKLSRFVNHWEVEVERGSYDL